MTTPSKLKEAAAVRRRQNAIRNAVEAAGTMTMGEILTHFEGSRRNISRGTVGHMIRCGMLEPHPTEARTKNGNIIHRYTVRSGKPSPREELEDEPFALGEAWGSHPRIQPIHGITRSNRISR